MQRIVAMLEKEPGPYQPLHGVLATHKVIINLNWDLDHQAVVNPENSQLGRAQLKL